MNIEIRHSVENGPFDEWDDYVRSHPSSVNYHQSGWMAVIEKTFGHKTFYISARSGDGKIAGILPLVYMKSRLFGAFMVSLPFFNYGGILCNDGAAESALTKEAEGLAMNMGAAYIELRNMNKTALPLVTRTHKVTVFLGLADSENAQWESFDPKLRNQIRKAEKSGLIFKAGGAELIDPFYDVFAMNMRDLGTPVYPKGFFRNVLSAFPAASKVFIVELGDKAVAAGISTWYKETVEMPWASSIRRYLPLCPNDLLYWSAIRFGIEKGFKWFDFGRSSPESGAYKFKEKWGGERISLYWQYWLKEGQALPMLSVDNPKYAAMIGLWRRLPLWITRAAGPAIVRFIP